MREENNEKKSKKKKSSIGGWLIALVLELMVICVLGYMMVDDYTEEKYERVEVVDLQEEDLAINEEVKENVEIVEGYTTIALFGIDARDNNLGKGSRSDSIMICSIDNKTKEVKIVSVYRDTLLEIQNKNKITTKVNAAYAYGGPELAIQTLNANLDLNITEYVAVNWLALTKAIDALGGVQVHVEQNELNTLNMALAEQIAVNGVYSEGVFETGDLILNGAQATAYARIRSTGQGDITRTERQREVIGAMLAKIKSSDFATLNSVIDEVSPYVSTSITKDEMMEMMKDVVSYNIGETMGFPMQWQFYNSNPRKGSCIGAQTLGDNITALHRFLYGKENYVPSSNAQRISSALESETGLHSKGEIVLPDAPPAEEPAAEEN